MVLVGMGEHLGERLLPIYLIALGGSPLLIGLLPGMDHLLSALYSYPGNHLPGPFGAKRTPAAVNLMAMAGYAR